MAKKDSQYQKASMSLLFRGKAIFKPLNTGKIDEKVACIREWVANIFFYTKNNTTIMIDALFVYEVVKGEGGTWEKGSKKDLEFVVKRSYDDSLTFEQFEKVMVDGKELSDNQYSVRKGSLVLDIKADYLKTLTVGDHTLEFTFKDGGCKSGFTVKESGSSKPDADSKEQYKLPLTGVE